MARLIAGSPHACHLGSQDDDPLYPCHARPDRRRPRCVPVRGTRGDRGDSRLRVARRRRVGRRGAGADRRLWNPTWCSWTCACPAWTASGGAAAAGETAPACVVGPISLEEPGRRRRRCPGLRRRTSAPQAGLRTGHAPAPVGRAPPELKLIRSGRQPRPGAATSAAWPRAAPAPRSSPCSGNRARDRGVAVVLAVALHPRVRDLQLEDRRCLLELDHLVIGFFILPWTTITYAMMWGSTPTGSTAPSGRSWGWPSCSTCSPGRRCATADANARIG